MRGTGELEALLWVQRRTAGPRRLRLARALGHAGEHGALWLATGLVGAAVDAPRRRRWTRATAAVLGAHAASVVLKRAVRRVRPVHEALVPGARVPSRWSFPSSHATSTTTAAVVLAPLLGRWTLALVPAMAWSRLVLGVHHPSDVLGGTVLGGAVGLLARRGAASGSRADGMTG